MLAGRSLIIDTGIHAFGWTRERAAAVAMATGMSKEEADSTIDRIAVEPGQLISYEVGGIVILSLRESARNKMGTRFDIRAFHRCISKHADRGMIMIVEWKGCSRQERMHIGYNSDDTEGLLPVYQRSWQGRINLLLGCLRDSVGYAKEMWVCRARICNIVNGLGWSRRRQTLHGLPMLS